MPAAEKTDPFAALVDRLGRWLILSGALAWVYVAVRWGWKGAAGFGFGVLGAFLNMRWLANGLKSPEGVAAGLVRLIGTSRDRIVAEAEQLLLNPGTRAAMSQGANPYGDGCAARRIVDYLLGVPSDEFRAAC